MTAWPIYSSRVQPLLEPPIVSHCPNDMAPLCFGATLLHGASEGLPADRGAVGGTISLRWTGALAC